jgi:hypothetical protein
MASRSASMNLMNEVIALRDFMETSEGWGRVQGREVYQQLLRFVESRPGVIVFKVSMKGVKRVDISFASETLVELARRYRGSKGFCFIDFTDADLIENWEAAAARKGQPIVVWEGKRARVIGTEPSQGNREALRFALERPMARAAEFAESAGLMIANASTKFKQLWEKGFLLRRESVADTGGVEFEYYRIG